MAVETAGDVEVRGIRNVLPTTESFFLAEFRCFCFDAERIVPMLFGDDEISIKLWKNEEGNGKPTIVHTGLKWKTFDMDDNILIMIKQFPVGNMPTITILITRKYQ